MVDSQTAKVIVWGVAGIVGLLLAVGRIRIGKRFGLRIGIGLALFAIALFVLVTEFPQYGIGFSIIGTMILAGVALMSIRQSREQAESDRRERKLAAIITWANDIAKCETEAPLTPLPVEELVKSAETLGRAKVEAIIEYRNRNAQTNLIMRYQNLEAMKARVVLMAHRLDKQLGSNLGILAEQTVDKLEKHVKLGYKFVAGETSDGDYKKHWKSLIDSAMALAEKAEEAAD